MNEKLKDEISILLLDLLRCGEFYHSAIELDMHCDEPVDGLQFKDRIEKVIIKLDSPVKITDPVKEMAVITGCESAEGFKKTCPIDELEKVAKEIYASHPGEDGYYRFTKFLWVLLPGAKEEVRLDSVIDYE